MAVIPRAGVEVPTLYGKSSIVTWSPLATGDTGEPLQGVGLSDRSVQFTGTFGGATVVLEGSNDGNNWVTLTDPAGVALSFTAAGLKQILQITRYMRPNVSDGAGVAIICNLLAVGK